MFHIEYLVESPAGGGPILMREEMTGINVGVVKYKALPHAVSKAQEILTREKVLMAHIFQEGIDRAVLTINRDQ